MSDRSRRSGQVAARTWSARIATALVVVLVVFVAWHIWQSGEVLAWLRDAPPLPFFAAIALLPAIGVPSTPLFLIAGATFGLATAIAGTLIALGLNLVLCYAIARALRPHILALLERTDYELPAFGSRRSAVRVTVLVKLTPALPTFVKHYGLGAAGIPFWIYFGVSLAITGAYAVALIVVGESLFTHELGPGTIAVAVLAIAGIAGALWIKRRGLRVATPAT